ncbi:uncharacterized protein ACIQIH_005241 isoform 2-T6 [Cyanocitta cristata]
MEADGLAKSESWRLWLSSPFPRWLRAQSDTGERPICFAALGLPRAPGYLADPGPAQRPIPQPAGSFAKGFRRGTGCSDFHCPPLQGYVAPHPPSTSPISTGKHLGFFESLTSWYQLKICYCDELLGSHIRKIIHNQPVFLYFTSLPVQLPVPACSSASDASEAR